MANSQPNPGALSGVRIYAQLKPDEAALARLLLLQAGAREAAPGTRLVSPDRLHLTLIHFGKADEAYSRLSAVTGTGPKAYREALADYLKDTTAALPETDFQLTPTYLSAFGSHGSTLALELRSTPALEALHAELYAVLLEFLSACGIADPAGYAAGDPALCFAAQLRPHISLLHGFRGFHGFADDAAPRVDPAPLRLQVTPVLYRV
ncbi:2'-5' RNA ligase family protein [Arthrobacter caoxuetaonis]|uniref:2'-5' RNA ligase family protein n=1 Tax=Arthrobacter caoxuetaonis TaxID=2886935 RepID=UPI001D14BDA9|nr:2'-5' RNA ligase family protein [Arthrobacter caoxuetaonis]